MLNNSIKTFQNSISEPFHNINIETKLKLRNAYGKREEVQFKYPCIIETKKDFCVIHNKIFDNQCHRLPSLKFHWEGCPRCKNQVNAKEAFNFISNYLKNEKGMKQEGGTWVSKDTSSEQPQFNKTQKVTKGY